MLKRYPICVSLLVCLGPLPASAGQSLANLQDGAVTVALMPAVTAYPGSRERGFTTILPNLSFHKVDERPTFSSPDDAFDIPLMTLGPVEIGPLLDFKKGRTSADVAAGRLATGSLVPQIGLTAESWINKNWRLRAEWRQGTSANDRGMRFDLGSDYVLDEGQRVWSLGPRLVYGGATYMKGQFASSTASVRSGFESIGLAGSLTQPIAPKLSATAFARADRFIGTAASSDVLKANNVRVALTAGIGLNYTIVWK
jgi:hypothetical protein